MNLWDFSTPELAAELISRPDGPAEYGRIMAGRRVYTKILKPCPCCAKPFGVADMRKHRHLCPDNPNRRKTKAGACQTPAHDHATAASEL